MAYQNIAITLPNGEIREVTLTEADASRAFNDSQFAQLIALQLLESQSSESQKEKKKCDPPLSKEFRWVPQAVKLLIATYKENEEKIHSVHYTKKKVWEIISHHLQQKGYDVTGEQCSSKWKLLVRLYKRHKDHNSVSGNDPAPAWQFFDEMDSLMGNKPEVTPVLTLSGTGAKTGKLLSDSDTDDGESGVAVRAGDSGSALTVRSGVSKKKAASASGSKKRKSVPHLLEEAEKGRVKRHEEKMLFKRQVFELLKERL